jgi:hypothetical protein
LPESIIIRLRDWLVNKVRTVSDHKEVEKEGLGAMFTFNNTFEVSFNAYDLGRKIMV